MHGHLEDLREFQTRLAGERYLAFSPGLIVGGSHAFAAAPDELWHGNVAVGGAFASGNTNSKVLTGAADATRVPTAAGARRGRAPGCTGA